MGLTHDELLAKLSNDENGYAGSTPLQRMYALRAVVEVLNKGFDFSDCEGCMRGFDFAKDKVIQAIEKELE